MKLARNDWMQQVYKDGKRDDWACKFSDYLLMQVIQHF